MSAATIPTVGYFPASFPRDPVNIDVYLEHVLVGQALEPLVESGPDGSIIPAVAASWKILNQGKEIHFFIRNGIRFSNGTLVTAYDVKYSLDRHIHSKDSQSKNYLNRIRSIEVLSPEELVFRLDEPYIAIFKVLSREHLGIVPKDWHFNPSAEEPFIGTGAYRILHTKKGWLLKANPLYRDISNVMIPEWKVLFFDPKSQKLKEQPIPDLIPFAPEDVIAQIAKNKNWRYEWYEKEEVTHFAQTSAWWNPHGPTYSDNSRKRLGMCAVRTLLDIQREKHGYRKATGLIPEGITGYLSNAPKIKEDTNFSEVTNRHFTFAVTRREYDEINSSEVIADVERKYSIRLNLEKIDMSEVNFDSLRKVDIVMFAFAGGFQDPEGFIPIVTSMLSMKLNVVFGSLYPLYLQASQEQNWDKRASLYQILNRSLSEELQVVPGWKLSISSLHDKSVILETPQLRYAIKLKDYKNGKEAI